MSRRLALSKLADRPHVVTRNPTGLATEFHPTRTAIWSKAYYYGVGFEQLGNWPNHSWALIVQDQDTVVDASIANDSEVILMPATWKFPTVMTTVMVNQANNALVQTDIDVVALSGRTVKQFVDDILNELGHMSGAVELIWGMT